MHIAHRPMSTDWAMCDIWLVTLGQKVTRCIQTRRMQLVHNLGRISDGRGGEQKSHFRPSDEKSLKNVDKDAVNTTIGLICYFRCMNILRKK